LESRFPRLLLGICELDTALEGLLASVGCSEVAAIVGHPVDVGQELLLIAEVGPKYIRLLLGVKPLCFAYSRSVEVAQY
jgi:hypothetical protein